MNHLPIYGISPRNKMSEKADTTTLLPKTYMPCSSSTRTNIKGLALVRLLPNRKAMAKTYRRCLAFSKCFYRAVAKAS